MSHEAEKWYQTTAWLSVEVADGRWESRFIALAPPRKLLADIKLDLTRESGAARAKYGKNVFRIGARVLWPEQGPEWIDESEITRAEAA